VNDILKITTFGGLTLQHDGNQVTGFVSRKVEALFVYLACNPGEHSRELLADLLWDDATTERAMSNLRTIIFNLQSLLAPYVLVSRQTIAINPETDIRLDTRIFEVGLDAAEQQAALLSTISRSTANAMEQALALYQGDFLAGFNVRQSRGFEGWQMLERERLRGRVIEAQYQLVNYYLDARQYSAGIGQAARLLQLDPLWEKAHRTMMLLLARSGQRSAALAQFETCKTLLQEELGVEPDSETKALCVRIRAGEAIGTAEIKMPLHNLPVPGTPFIDRPVQLARLQAQFDNPDCRLLTITGMGGSGKSRLALQLAALRLTDFSHGIFHIPLLSMQSAEMLAGTILHTIKNTANPADNAQTQLFTHLAKRCVLLVLDDMEHLLDGADLLVEILARSPDVKIIVTSREMLNLHQEWPVTIYGMDYPAEADDSLDQYEAVQLFVQSARRAQPDFSLAPNRHAVARICQLVQGIPLNIELAAAWLRVMPCDQIADEVERGLDILQTTMRNIPERHRSVRANFETSWQLLKEGEREALRRLSVFEGPFQPKVAQQITNTPTLTLLALRDKSLVDYTKDGYCEMPRLLRQFAAEKLREYPPEEEQMKIAHRDYYAAQA
jgi:predicted ATPase/DNA-binding SARP family transcriptional activator